MYGESVCFLLGFDKELSHFIEKSTSKLNARSPSLRRLDSSTTNRLMSIGSGCVVVSEEVWPNGTVALASFFFMQRLWMPVITLCDTKDTDARITKQTGVFARVNMPITNDELTHVLEEALECDLSGQFSPAAHRAKMLQLTRREKQTIELFLDGHNTKVVAKSLDVTHQTVDKHRGRALRKLGMRTVVELQNAMHKTMLASIGMDSLTFANPRAGLDSQPSSISPSYKPEVGELRRDAS